MEPPPGAASAFCEKIHKQPLTLLEPDLARYALGASRASRLQQFVYFLLHLRLRVAHSFAETAELADLFLKVLIPICPFHSMAYDNLQPP